MKYLCLGYYDPDAFDAASAEEMREIVNECRPRDAELHASGHLDMVASLAHRTVVTIRPEEGESVVADGPFVESKEQVGSFFIVEARDLNEAVRIASKHPAAQIGEDLGWAVEVRPIDRMNGG